MKKITTLFFSVLLTVNCFGQNTPDYKNWIVDFTKARSSFLGVQLDKLELNDKYTVAHMSFNNYSFSTQHIEACNTFHIRAKGKKIATFIKAENIPTRYVNKTGFTCADIETAMKIKPGQFVRFRIYFTRIPEYLDRIDIIEYDGEQECEFDIFNLNITQKQALPPSLYSYKKQQNTIASKSPIKSNSIAAKKTPQKKKLPANSTKPPVVSSDEPTGTASTNKIENNIPKEPTVPPVTPPERREVVIKKEYTIKPRLIILEIYDNDQEDGDKVSIMLNKRWILRGLAVTKNKKQFEIPLEKGDNVLTFHADNLGTAPPNTAALKFFDGLEHQTIVLNSDMDKSEALRLIRVE